MQQVVKALFALTITQGKHTCSISKDDILYVSSNKFVKNGVIVDIRDFPGAFEAQAGQVPAKYPIMEFTAGLKLTGLDGKTTTIEKGTQFIKYDTVELINDVLVDTSKFAFCLKVVSAFKLPANLAFGEESYSVAVGDTTATSVTKDTDADISYEISDPDLATIDENGVLTGIEAGEVTLTAITPETDEYKSGEASVQVTITA